MREGARAAAITAAILAACGGQAERQPPAAESAKAWAVRPTREDLTCSPSTVRPDSPLVLRMETPHGASLYIGAPDGTLYLVIFHGEGKPDRAARRSLMPPETFAQMKELRVKVGTLTGGAWVFGRDTNEVVFRDRGTYRVRVGHDMETDGPVYAECLVSFDPSA